jgi:tellurite resistance protein TerA
MNLVPGANAPVNCGALRVAVEYSPIAGADLDVSAFLLSTSGKVRSDSDMCFYGQPIVENGAVEITISQQGRVEFSVHLDQLNPQIEKVAFTATIHENKKRFSAVNALSMTLDGSIRADIATSNMSETALILGEFYRRNGLWKFRCIAQGFNGGLEPLAEYFGIDVAKPASAPTPVPAPTPAPAINLSKITLDKSRKSISLEKGSGSFGEIKVNLNWNMSPQPQQQGGFLSRLVGGGSKNIDLDIGCLFELEDGTIGAVQALGNAFGSFRDRPYIALMGDDRTGSNADGEWLKINGDQWPKIRRILVYAFIYEGAPNWSATDAVVTVMVPNQPPVEVRVSEEGGSQNNCAIALIENENGAVKLSREVRFFSGHEPMDHAYNWGLRWTAGSK